MYHGFSEYKKMFTEGLIVPGRRIKIDSLAVPSGPWEVVSISELNPINLADYWNERKIQRNPRKLLKGCDWYFVDQKEPD